MALRSLTSFPALALALALWPGPFASAHAATLFCCNDPSGKQVCSDILPQECYGRAYRELGESGRTLRTVEAPLTAEQRAQRAAAEEQRKADESIVRQKQRKDQALLNTYGSEKDIEAMRARAQDDVNKAIAAAETRIAELRVKRKSFENEAEFYKKKALPPDVQKGLREADFEIKQQETLIESKKKDLEALLAKYDDDRRRYIELVRRGAAPR